MVVVPVVELTVVVEIVVLVPVTEVVEVTVLVLEVVVVATQLSNVLSWYRSIASFRYATALHESLKSLIKPEPLQPKISLATLPLVSRDTIVFNSAETSTQVPDAACRM